jgi:O-antigen ligase
MTAPSAERRLRESMIRSPRSVARPASARLTRASRAASAPADGRLRIVRDPLRVTLCALTIITISRVHQHYPLLEKFRPALLLVVAAIGIAYLNPRYLTSFRGLRLWPMRLVAALAILACGSAVFGISLGGSASFILGSYVKTLGYAFLIAVSIRHVRDLYTFVWAYVVSCGILAFFSLFVFGISKGGGYVTRLNDLYTYDSNDLGVVMMVGLPMTMLLLSVERGAKRWILATILIGIAATMARSGSRGGFLGFIAVGLAGLFLVKGVSAVQKFLVLAAAGAALVVGAPPGYWKQMGTILAPKADYNYTDIDGRKAVTERGIGYMISYPAFGLGINNFSRAECSISPKLASLRRNGPMRCTAPHNSYVQAGAELGVPGLLVWVSLVIGGIFAPALLRPRLPKSWRRGTQSERFIYGATSFFAVSMIGFAVTSFFVSFAWMDTVYLMAALLSGLYVAAQAQFGADDRLGVSANSILPPGPSGGRRIRQSVWRSDILATQMRTR